MSGPAAAALSSRDRPWAPIPLTNPQHPERGLRSRQIATHLQRPFKQRYRLRAALQMCQQVGEPAIDFRRVNGGGLGIDPHRDAVGGVELDAVVDLLPHVRWTSASRVSSPIAVRGAHALVHALLSASRRASDSREANGQLHPMPRVMHEGP